MVKNGALFHAHVGLAQRTGTDVKWLKRHDGERKVEWGTPARVSAITLHFANYQAHYLISLAAVLYDKSLSGLKANLQQHTASEICDEQVESNNVNFEIYSKMLRGCQNPEGFHL